jgi:hypothetical protein
MLEFDEGEVALLSLVECEGGFKAEDFCKRPASINYRK